jgi:translation initiation factor eIF-2B subunit beta
VDQDHILTYGFSSTVVDFLQEAHEDGILFDVLVCEAAPNYQGLNMIDKLLEKKMQATLIPDSNAFAIMSRVNKVIIGTQAIMANGGLVTNSGAYMIALAAQVHSVPVFVVSAITKLTPLYPFDHHTFNQLQSPQLLNLTLDSKGKQNVDVVIPQFDYVPPELVSLFVTNLGGQTPNYIYSLFSEFYNKDDLNGFSDDED